MISQQPSMDLHNMSQQANPLGVYLTSPQVTTSPVVGSPSQHVPAFFVPYVNHMQNTHVFTGHVIFSLLIALLIGLIIYRQNPPSLQKRTDEPWIQSSPNISIILIIIVVVFFVLMALPAFVKLE